MQATLFDGNRANKRNSLTGFTNVMCNVQLCYGPILSQKNDEYIDI